MFWATFVVSIALCLVAGVFASGKGRAGVSFWKVYGAVVAMDLFLYVLIFLAGRAIPPASPDTSFPGNYALALGWLTAHFPATAVFYKRALSESLLWLLTLQDAWLAGLIYIWARLSRQRRLSLRDQAAAAR